MANYFNALTPPTAPESAQDYSNRIQTELDAAVARDNALAELAQLVNSLFAGPGRFVDRGAEVSVSGGAVRVSNGWFLAGPGAGIEDASYFEGLRPVQVAAEIGYVQLAGADAPPLNKSGGTWGYLSAFGDAVWFDTEQTTDEEIAALNGRWRLGKVVTDGSGAASIDTATTQTLSSLAQLDERLADAEAAIALFEELSAGAIPTWGALKKSASDPTTIQQAINAAVAGVSSGGTGGTVTTESVLGSDSETIVNQLRQAATMQMAFDNSLGIVPLKNAFVFSPGRGNWADLYDADFTTVNLDTLNNVIG